VCVGVAVGFEPTTFSSRSALRCALSPVRAYAPVRWSWVVQQRRCRFAAVVTHFVTHAAQPALLVHGDALPRLIVDFRPGLVARRLEDLKQLLSSRRIYNS